VVLELLGQRPGPRLIAGDFNLDPGDVDPILAAHGFAAAPSTPTSTAAHPTRRIDYIACDAGFRVVATRVHAPLVSDHRPLVVDLAVATG
jgi:endonuclease/exonuclease/phosphatase family metal-dependent hydrolase